MPGFQFYWKSQKYLYDPSFQDFVENDLKDIVPINTVMQDAASLYESD